jgi:ketosteroid isomerase-like protein
VAERESEFLNNFRAAFEEGNRAWNEGEFERAYGWLPADLRYELSSTWPNAQALCGPAEIVQFFRDFRETFPDARADLGEFVEVGDETGVVELRVSGTGGSSEARTAMEIWQVWEMPGGMPVRVREFRDRRSAIDAARAAQTTEQQA